MINLGVKTWVGFAVFSVQYCAACGGRHSCVQVSLFIVDSDGAGAVGTNLYYANTFGTDLGETTASAIPGPPNLAPNIGDAISDAVLDFTPMKGSSNFAAGLSDLAVQFGDLTAADPSIMISYAGIALLITDGTALPPAALGPAVRALKLTPLGIPVTVGVVGVGPFVEEAQLNAIASPGANGRPLVALTDFFDTIGDALRELLENIGAHLSHANLHQAHASLPYMSVQASLPGGVAGRLTCDTPWLLMWQTGSDRHSAAIRNVAEGV